MLNSRQMVRSFLTLSSGETVARAMHVLAVILLGRALGPERFGLFEFALAITTYALLGVRQGFDVLATQEVARDRSREWSFLAAILRLRLLLAIAAVAVSLGWAWFVGWDRPLATLLMLFTGSYLASAITPRWRFLALEEPRLPAFASVVSQMIFLGVVAVFVHVPRDAGKAAIGWVTGELAEAAILWIAWRPAQPHPITSLTKASSPVKASWLLRESIPLSVSLLLGQIMYNFDILALAWSGRTAEIGLYLASYRCATGFAPLLGNLQASIFPQLARLHRDSDPVPSAAWKLAAWAAVSGFAIALMITLEARTIIDLVFGPKYQAATPFLQILIWILPLQFPRAVLRQMLLASGGKRFDTRNVALGAAANITIDVASVPAYGALGCSVSSVCSELVLLAATWQAVRRGVAVAKAK